MTKCQTFLTCASYGVYVATSNVVRYASNYLLTKQYLPYTFYQRSVLSHSGKRQCRFAALLDECHQTVFHFQ